MQSVFVMLKKEDLPEEYANVEETESVLTFGRAASPEVDDPEPEANHLQVNPPTLVVPPWLDRAQPRSQ